MSQRPGRGPQRARTIAFCCSTMTLITVAGCSTDTAQVAVDRPSLERRDLTDPEKPWDEVSEIEWKERLTPEQFRVARKHGTERPFRNEYWESKKDGVYECVCCGLPLFASETKYKSGTGWPSFWRPLNETNVAETDDSSLLLPRTEVSCSRCDAHLGHVFADGPRPTGQRYCINSASLSFRSADEVAVEKQAVIPVTVMAKSPSRQSHAFAVAELFTSEGCSSCPPADRVLARLRAEKQNGGNVYCLGFQVDYWDRLGWKDRFSSPTCRTRKAAECWRQLTLM